MNKEVFLIMASTHMCFCAQTTGRALWFSCLNNKNFIAELNRNGNNYCLEHSVDIADQKHVSVSVRNNT